ncbi:hypothetical protein MK489_12370 [Myxococcota bacterium]|nr:hypothetical protein [Myxococcota bacterium]
MVEPSAKFTDIKIPLLEPQHGLDHVSGVLGTPRWWPTGARVSVVLAHGSTGGMDTPLIDAVHRHLTEQRYLTLRFNFPFAEANKKRKDSMPVLRRALQAAIATLNADPTAAPAHLFVGGIGLGAQVASGLAGARLRVDGLMLMGFPLHKSNAPEDLQADDLFRVVAPMLFIQGTRDRFCDVNALRNTLGRVGAPTTMFVSQDADHQLRVTKKSERSNERVHYEVSQAVDGWIGKILES